MTIYIVSHYYDNGESYEDYREFEDHSYYSTFELANTIYWDKVTSDYEGKYVLKSVVLDTQETNILEESEYLTCHSQWDDYYNQENPEPDDDYYPEYPDEEDTYDSEEDALVEEYLHSEGTNLKTIKEIDAEIEERKQAILVDSLNADLDELLPW